jgi:hypothetical protein
MTRVAKRVNLGKCGLENRKFLSDCLLQEERTAGNLCAKPEALRRQKQGTVLSKNL